MAPGNDKQSKCMQEELRANQIQEMPYAVQFRTQL